MKKFIEDFKSFAMKGNVIDLAIGVIIGGAFGKIVTSLVNDMIMPLLSLILGKVTIATAEFPIKALNGEVVSILKYGAFLQNIIDFLIISLSIFLFIRLLSSFKKKEKEEAETVAEVVAEAKLSKEEELLTEIRDLLKNRDRE